MSLFTILLGGDLTVTSRLRRQMHGAHVIAADSGISHAAALGVSPELWVGDFDSSTEADHAAHANVPRDTFPAAKDQTDGELAVDIALKRGATRLILAGAFGGPRVDHAFLHLTLGLSLAERGVDILLSSGTQEGVPLLPGERTLDYDDGTLFSVLGFSELEGLSLIGAQWPLDRVHVPFGSSLTISNRVTGNLVARLSSGRAMIIAHPEGY
ncbi:MAG: thiamine diphosphokinase [Mesorhizobium sp.]